MPYSAEAMRDAEYPVSSCRVTFEYDDVLSKSRSAIESVSSTSLTRSFAVLDGLGPADGPCQMEPTTPPNPRRSIPLIAAVSHGFTTIARRFLRRRLEMDVHLGAKDALGPCVLQIAQSAVRR